MNSAYMAHPPDAEEIERIGEEEYDQYQTVVFIRCVLLNRLPYQVSDCEEGVAVTISSGGHSYTLPAAYPTEETVIRDSVLNRAMPRGLVNTYTVHWDNLSIMLPGAPYHGNGPEYLAYPFEFDEGVHISVHSADNTKEFGSALCKGAGEETMLSYPRGSVQVLFRQYHCCDGEVDYNRSCKRRVRTPPVPLTPPAESSQSEQTESVAKEASAAEESQSMGQTFPSEQSQGVGQERDSTVESESVAKEASAADESQSRSQDIDAESFSSRASSPVEPANAAGSPNLDKKRSVGNIAVKEVELGPGSYGKSTNILSKSPSPCLASEAASDSPKIRTEISEEPAREAQLLAEEEEQRAAAIQETARTYEEEKRGAERRVEIHREAIEAEDRVMNAQETAAQEERDLAGAYAAAKDTLDEEDQGKEEEAREREALALERKEAAAQRKAKSIELRNRAEEDLGKWIAAADEAAHAAKKAQKEAEDAEREAVSARDAQPTDDATYALLNKTADLYLQMAEKERECATVHRTLSENLVDGSKPAEMAEEADRLAEEAEQCAKDIRPAPQTENEKKEDAKPPEGPKQEPRKGKAAEEAGGCLC